MKLDDAGEQMKDPNFRDDRRCDGSLLSRPSTSQFPGLLKHALRHELKEYIHKRSGFGGVSLAPGAPE